MRDVAGDKDFITPFDCLQTSPRSNNIFGVFKPLENLQGGSYLSEYYLHNKLLYFQIKNDRFLES